MLDLKCAQFHFATPPAIIPPFSNPGLLFFCSFISTKRMEYPLLVRLMPNLVHLCISSLFICIYLLLQIACISLFNSSISSLYLCISSFYLCFPSLTFCACAPHSGRFRLLFLHESTLLLLLLLHRHDRRNICPLHLPRVDGRQERPVSHLW